MKIILASSIRGEAVGTEEEWDMVVFIGVLNFKNNVDIGIKGFGTQVVVVVFGVKVKFVSSHLEFSGCQNIT